MDEVTKICNEKLTKEKILSVKQFTQTSTSEQLNCFGGFVDFNSKVKDKELVNHLLILSENFDLNSMDSTEKARYYYVLSEIWKINYGIDKSLKKFNQDSIAKYIVYLRTALVEISKVDLKSKFGIDLYCRINTNLGNQFIDLGRMSDAIECFNRVININPDFKMATANLANVYFLYQSVFYNNENRFDFINSSYYLFKEVNEKKVEIYNSFTEEAKIGFRERMNIIKQHFPNVIKKRIKYEIKVELPRKERNYRLWCLNNCLFLNEMNDLTKQFVSAEDHLYLPPMIFTEGFTIYHLGLFNQIKQEYVSARYMLYESIKDYENENKHFSDRNNYLEDTNDFSLHSLNTEKIKSSFRILYSILDKIAYFLNKYFDVGKNKDRVNFRNLWYDKDKKLHSFVCTDNFMIEGLYWLSRDIFRKENSSEEYLLPDARELNEIRNQLEHKYLKIVLIDCQDFDYFNDTLAYRITLKEFHSKTIRLAKMVRTAILHLSFSINIEERKKSSNIPSEQTAKINCYPLNEEDRY